MNAAEEYHIKKIEKLIKMNIPLKSIPAKVAIENTSFEEQQLILREIDFQKRKDNPEFKGAFHDKKLRKKNKLRRKRN